MTDPSGGQRSVDPGGSLVEFFRNSPLAEAIAAGEISPDAFERRPDLMRDVDFGGKEPPNSESFPTSSPTHST